MPLASDSQIIGIVDIDQLLALQTEVTGNLPEAHKGVAASVLRALTDEFIKSCRSFADFVVQVDWSKFNNAQFLDCERSVKVVIKAMELHMLSQKSAADCQPLTETYRRVRDILDRLESGLPVDPAQSPSVEEMRAMFNQDLESLHLV
jgi:hypothetical protein